MFKHSCRGRLLNDSIYPFRQGSPGGIYRIPIRSWQNPLSAWETSSGPLSHRRIFGFAPRRDMTSSMPATTSSPVMDRLVRSRRDSRVCSSPLQAILKGPPSWTESNWKSIVHTTLGLSASIIGPVDDPTRSFCVGYGSGGLLHARGGGLSSC